MQSCLLALISRLAQGMLNSPCASRILSKRLPWPAQSCLHQCKLFYRPLSNGSKSPFSNQPFQDVIQFTCGSIACAQMFLGVGQVLLQSDHLLVYSSFEKVYVCQVASGIYTCRLKGDGRSPDPFEGF